MHDDTTLPFALPPVGRKKLVAAFDGGRLTSDGGVLLLSAAQRRLDLAGRLAAGIADPHDPARVWHPLADILRARMLAIACGYEDADDLDRLRTDPGLKLACGRLPDTGRDLPSQSTVSRWENAPTLREVIGLMRTMVDVHCASYARPPATVTLDIDDTCDVVRGHQQLSLFDGHCGERCFLPIHVHDVETSRLVMVLLRPEQDAVGQGGARASAPPGAPHPMPLADHTPDDPRRRPLRPGPGPRSAAQSPASKPQHSGSISASWSPACRAAAPNGFTTPSTAPRVRRRT